MLTEGNYTVTQGFHQPTELIEVGILHLEPKIANVMLFPNPAREAVYIRIEGTLTNYHVMLTDVLGRVLCAPMELQRGGNETNYSISLSGYSNGIYLVHLVDTGDLLVQRIRFVKLSN